MYSPERVSTLTLSPMSTKSGTLIVAPQFAELSQADTMQVLELIKASEER